MVMVLIALGSLTYIHYEQNHVVSVKQSKLTSSGSSLTVDQANGGKLSTSNSASDTPPASNGSQTTANNDLQSNVNINDPALANNSLIRSVSAGSSQ